MSESSVFLDFIVLIEGFKKIHKSGWGKKSKINLVKFLERPCLYLKGSIRISWAYLSNIKNFIRYKPGNKS